MIKFRDWMNEKEGKETKDSAYQAFFKKKLEKYGVKSASELTGEDKKKFFDEVDAEWEGENEEPEAGDVNESTDDIKKNSHLIKLGQSIKLIIEQSDGDQQKLFNEILKQVEKVLTDIVIFHK